MLFNSSAFLLFFPSVVLLYFLLPRRLKNPCLLFASYFFYACWNPKYIVLLFVTTFVTFFGGLLVQRCKDAGPGGDSQAPERGIGNSDQGSWNSNRRSRNSNKRSRVVLVLVLLFNFGLLFLFKYYNWAAGLLELLLGKLHVSFAFPAFELALPVGISFFTFQAVGYTIDVYRGEIRAERNFFKYALFVSFFPQLVAGPIERSRTLLAQLDESYSFDYERVRKGLLIMLWGFFLKVVLADRAAVLVNQVYGNYASYYGMQLILASLCFALQIYCDFMGYSTIARGAALVLGFRLTDNFKQPYLACSVKDFWRRWHVSLSFWLRDYLYIPLGGSRCSRLRRYRNLLITFAASGLWHGASVKFIVWGLLHGFFQIAEDCFSRKKGGEASCEDSFSRRLFLRLRTFFLVTVAWVFFRAESFTQALKILKKSLRLTNIGLFFNEGIFDLGLSSFNVFMLLLGLLVLFTFSIMKEKGRSVLGWLSTQETWFRFAIYWFLLLMIMFSLNLTGTEFIYFQF